MKEVIASPEGAWQSRVVIIMQKGVSIIGAVFALLILGIFGAALVAVVSHDHESRRLQIEREQAFYESQAGFEYALREIDQGGYPVVANKQLSTGTFTTSIDFSQHLIYSTGTVGESVRTHQITYTSMGGDCLATNNSQATLVGPGKTDLKGITLKKNCNDAITIDKFQLSWSPDNGEKVTKIIISNDTVYNDVIGTPSGGIIDIADYALSSGNAYQINLIQFTGNMLNKQLTMVVYMTDTSYKSMTFTILPPNQ